MIIFFENMLCFLSENVFVQEKNHKQVLFACIMNIVFSELSKYISSHVKF